MVFFPFGGGYLLLILAMIVLGGAAQTYVNSTYRRFSSEPSPSGATGAQFAREMLDQAGLSDVGIEEIGGSLTDHYDPRARVLRLSRGVYEGRSIAAAGVASHEAGHAVQHARAFVPARLRQALVPAANLGSSLAWPLILVGIFIGGSTSSLLIQAGIALYVAAVLFQIVTLPVEFDASHRAMGYLTSRFPATEVSGARRVLNAAALTYVAATLIAVLQLLYLVGLSRRR